MKLLIIWAVCCALARPQTLELFLSAKKQSPDQDKLSRMKIALHTNNLPAAEDLFCFYYINGLTANSNYHEARREARSFHKNFPESPFLNQVLRLENIIEYYSLESGIFFKRLTNLSDLSFFYKYFKEKNLSNEALEVSLRLIEYHHTAAAAREAAEYTAEFLKKCYPQNDITNLALIAGTNTLFLYKFSHALYKARRYDFSSPLFLFLLGKRGMSDARYYLGASFYNQGRYEDALEYLGLFRKTMPADGELSWWADFYYARSLERMKRLREAYLMARNMLGKREKQDLYLMLLRLSEDLAPDEYKNYKNLFLKKFPGSYLSYLIYKKDAFTELRSSNYDSGLAYLKKAYSSRRDDYTAIENICRGRDLSGIVISNTDLFYNYIFFLEPSAVNTATNFSEFIKTHDAEIFDESEEDINILNNCLHPLAFQAEKSKKSFVMGTDGFFSNYYTFLPEAAGHAYHERFSLLLLFEEYDALSREINRVFSDQPEKAFYYLNKLDDQKNDLYSSLLRAARIINARMSFLQLIPYDFLKLSWPLYKKDTVLYFSRLYRVPPLLVYAVIREESHFKTGAFSEAGASGLMQLMDSTAREIFRKRRLNEFYEYNLKDDVLNLQLGIDHLGTLLSQFKGSLMHTVAAYNGGGGNVRKWMQGSYRDLLHFVLFIPFDQTEQYVKKVMTSYYIYNCLYQDDPDFFPEKKNNIK